MNMLRSITHLSRRLDNVQIMLWCCMLIGLINMGILFLWEYRLHRFKQGFSESRSELMTAEKQLREAADSLRPQRRTP